MRIPVRRGDTTVYALIDADDARRLPDLSWHVDSQGYPSCRRPGPRRGPGVPRGYVGGRMHDLILGPAGKGLVTDHRNGDKLDNRRANLRRVPQQVNCQNLAGATTRGFRGVYLDRRRGTWYAQVKHSGVKHSAGSGFQTAEEAAAAAVALRTRLFPLDERGSRLQVGD